MRISLTITQISPESCMSKEATILQGRMILISRSDSPCRVELVMMFFLRKRSPTIIMRKMLICRFSMVEKEPIPVASFYRILTITV